MNTALPNHVTESHVKPRGEVVSFGTEGFKQLFELMKHCTTLDAGALLLTASLHPNMNSSGKLVLGVGFASLAISMIASLIHMAFVGLFFLDQASDQPEFVSSDGKMTRAIKFGTLAFVISLGAFAFGIILVAISALAFRA